MEDIRPDGQVVRGFASFSFFGRVQGVFVLGLAALVALVLLAIFAHSERIILCGFGIILIMVLAIGWRVVRGGEQGPTDAQVTRDGVYITNIPLQSTNRILRHALETYVEQHLGAKGLPAPANTQGIADPAAPLALTEGDEDVEESDS